MSVFVGRVRSWREAGCDPPYLIQSNSWGVFFSPRTALAGGTSLLLPPVGKVAGCVSGPGRCCREEKTAPGENYLEEF